MNVKIVNDDEQIVRWSHTCWDGHATAAVGITYQVVQCTTRDLDQTPG